MLMIACILVVGLFVYRPKTIWVTGPFIAVAVVTAMVRGWLRKHRR